MDDFRNVALTSLPSTTRRPDARIGYSHHVREIGARAGVAINPQPPTAMLADVIADCDQIVVMSVEPGFGGQSFIEHALVEVRQVRHMVDAHNPRCDIEVDGGLGAEKMGRAVAAGAAMLVAGSSIFKADDPSAAPGDMRHRIGEQTFK